MERDYRIARSYRLSLLLDLIYGSLGLAIYYFISQTVGDISASDLDGAPSYFAFAAVGAVLGAVLQAGTAAIALRVREEQLTGTLEALASQPLNAGQICVGFVGFPSLFAALKAVVYLLISILWMDLDASKTDWVGLAVVLATSALALAVLGVLAGALVLVFKRAPAATGLGVAVMGLLSGAVFPIEVLPDWLQAFSVVMPLRYALDGLRNALFTGSGWEGDALVLLLFGVVGLPVGFAIFARAMRFVRGRGSLGQY